MKSKHQILLVVTLCLAFSGSGCFEIAEDITIHNYGYGEFFYTVNLRQSKANLNILMPDDSSEGYLIPSRKEIDNDISRTKLTLEKQQGITAAASTTDLINYIFTLKFAFSTIQQLNAAVGFVCAEFAADHKCIPEASGNFAFAGKTFHRLFHVLNGLFLIAR